MSKKTLKTRDYTWPDNLLKFNQTILFSTEDVCH